ncbi:hypothetical protein KY346_00675 [Candidatus Woesearchaeota archaeon]|nr:hypothetical protein [Candidatus Woesearchaeota archaeon]
MKTKPGRKKIVKSCSVTQKKIFVEQKVKDLQRLLGLTDWKITILYSKDWEFDNETAAKVQTWSNYLRAEIKVHKDLLDFLPEQSEFVSKVLLHELVHVLVAQHFKQQCDVNFALFDCMKKLVSYRQVQTEEQLVCKLVKVLSNDFGKDLK